tara:strand:+ start:803 stop:1213 length:411 start_codon:yes stop_codon:yes gene_type:complete
MKTSLTTLILDAIEFELDSNEYSNGLDNSNWQSWNDKEKFQWCYNLWYSNLGQDDIENWLRGLAIPIPYWNDEIENLGHNSETYWTDCACEIVNQAGLEHVQFKRIQHPELWREPLGKTYTRPVTMEGTFIPNFHD